MGQGANGDCHRIARDQQGAGNNSVLYSSVVRRCCDVAPDGSVGKELAFRALEDYCNTPNKKDVAYTTVATDIDTAASLAAAVARLGQGDDVNPHEPPSGAQGGQRDFAAIYKPHQAGIRLRLHGSGDRRL